MVIENGTQPFTGIKLGSIKRPDTRNVALDRLCRIPQVNGPPGIQPKLRRIAEKPRKP